MAASAIQEVLDENGKSFSVDISKICDINGDLGNKTSTSITDNMKNRVAKVHDIEYVNQGGEAIDAMQVLKDMASGKTQVLALDVEMEATHSGKNHNYCIYYEDSMEKDAESFVNPFKKPMLKNHNDYSGEPLGRIMQAWHGPSQLTDERSAIHLKARVTDQDAIPKFLDGRYGTVSIGGSMGTVTCNVCGKTILKDGKFKFCGHWRGETYKDQVCYWGAKDIEYHEVSTVNNPADDYAQIMKVTVVTDSDNKKDSKEEPKMGDTTNGSDSTVTPVQTTISDTTAEDIKKKVCDMVDDILNSAKAAATDSSDNNNNPEGTQDSANQNENTQPTAENNNTDTTQDSLNQEIEQLKQQLADANEKNEALQNELNDSKAALEKAENELKDSQAEATALKDKCLTLATANKELVADSVISKEKKSGKVTNETEDARRKELLEMSMKDLQKVSEETAVEDTQVRTPATVTNPTLSNTDSKDNEGTKDEANGEDTNKAKKTIEDYTNSIVNKLIR